MNQTAETDRRYMSMALEEARRAAAEGEVPVGAVVVSPSGAVIGCAHNLTERLTDVTAHAEMLAITAAANALGGKYLPGCTLYVTLEPCLMCAGAIAWSRIGRIVYGASDPKQGYTTRTSRPEVFHPRAVIATGVLAEECAAVLSEFFLKKRANRN